MKSTQQYFPVVLFIMLYKVAQTFRPVDEVYLAVVSVLLFAVLYYVALNFESVEEILPASKKYFPPAMFVMLYNAVLGMESSSVTIQLKATTEQYFPVVLFIMMYKVTLIFQSVDEVFLAVVFYAAVCSRAAQRGSTF